jgi:hypothetical protein
VHQVGFHYKDHNTSYISFCILKQILKKLQYLQIMIIAAKSALVPIIYILLVKQILGAPRAQI